MKTRILLGMLVMALAGAAQATLVTNWNSGDLGLGGIGVPVPDDNAAGLKVSQTFTGLNPGSVSSVAVTFDIIGGYNSDLYGYLIWQSLDNPANTRTALLLNRVGTTSSNPFGTEGSGFSHITLSDAGSQDIHTVDPGSGLAVSTGTYLADQSAGANSLNSTFAGATANGTWTLYLVDASGGEVSTLVSWGLNISVVPEPATWALGAFGVFAGVGLAVRRRTALRKLADRVNAWVDAV